MLLPLGLCAGFPPLVFYPKRERATRDRVRAGVVREVDFGEGGLSELRRTTLLPGRWVNKGERKGRGISTSEVERFVSPHRSHLPLQPSLRGRALKQEISL